MSKETNKEENEMSNQVTTTQPRSVIADMAERYGMDKRAFEATLKATVVPANVTNEQFAAFLLVAKQYKLNPITKEIYAFPARGGIQPIVGIDGWSNIINSHPQLDGIEFQDHLTEEGKLTAITCRIYRKDRSRPVSTTEYMEECNRSTETWKKWPNRMLRHKALIQCARIAFGFSGIVDPDEAERIAEAEPEIAHISPTDGIATARQVFGSAKKMNEKWSEVSDRITSAESVNGVEAIMKELEVDIQQFRSVDPQLADSLEVVANNRIAAIESVIDADFESVDDDHEAEADECAFNDLMDSRINGGA